MLTRARFASGTTVDKFSSAVTEMDAHSHDNGAWVREELVVLFFIFYFLVARKRREERRSSSPLGRVR